MSLLKRKGPHEVRFCPGGGKREVLERGDA